MSWIEKIRNGLIITTGDGRSYFPEWMNAIKEKEFNVAEFEFPEVSGTLVSRRKPKGNKYNLEIYFQGDNHLDTASDFELSSEDERPWVIEHPFYGRLLVQPIKLTFDNKDLNVTKITGVVAETLLASPVTRVDPVDFTVSQFEFTATAISDAFVLEIPNLSPSDLTKVADDIATIYYQGKKKIKLTIDAEKYFNLFNDANNFIVDITAEPLAAMRAIQAMIHAPVYFIDTVQNRLLILVAQFNSIRVNISNFTTREEKKIYESYAGSIVSSIALTAVSNYAYENRDEVLLTMENIIAQYDGYLSDLDSLQTNNANSPDSYIPDADSMVKLSLLVNYVVSNLFSISTSARQERSTFVESDTNIVTLAHRFYGLQPDDSTIQKLIKDNNIGIDEYLEIKQGREIIWFV